MSHNDSFIFYLDLSNQKYTIILPCVKADKKNYNLYKKIKQLREFLNLKDIFFAF